MIINCRDAGVVKRAWLRSKWLSAYRSSNLLLCILHGNIYKGLIACKINNLQVVKALAEVNYFCLIK